MTTFLLVDGNATATIRSYFKSDHMGCKFCIIKKNWCLETDTKPRDKADREILFPSY